MTNYQIRSNLTNMLSGVEAMRDQVYNVDSTPSNLDNQQWFENAEQFAQDALSITPSDANSADATVTDAYNQANVKYKVFKSVFAEFGSDRLPSFASAVLDAVKALPTTIGNAVGTVVDEAGNAGFGVIKAFFGRLGIFGWLLLIGGAFAILTYVFPQWIVVVKGLAKK